MWLADKQESPAGDDLWAGEDWAGTWKKGWLQDTLKKLSRPLGGQKLPGTAMGVPHLEGKHTKKTNMHRRSRPDSDYIRNKLETWSYQRRDSPPAEVADPKAKPPCPVLEAVLDRQWPLPHGQKGKASCWRVGSCPGSVHYPRIAANLKHLYCLPCIVSVPDLLVELQQMNAWEISLALMCHMLLKTSLTLLIAKADWGGFPSLTKLIYAFL